MKRSRREQFAQIELQDESHRRAKAEQALLHAQKLEALGQLTGGVAHDFNNLLGQIQILVSNLRTEVPPDSGMEGDLAAIEEKVDDASQLVGNLLALRETVLADAPVWLEPVLRGDRHG